MPFGSLFFGGNYSKYLNEWRKYDRLNSEVLEKIRIKNLKKILDYAQKNVPYYQSLQLKEGASLSDFPILTKEILRAKSVDLCSTEFNKKTLEKHHSSGSSGVQSFVYMTSDYRTRILATQIHWWEWGGYQQGDVLLQTGMSPNRTLIKKLKDFFFRVVYLEAFNLDETIIEKQIARVEKQKNKSIAGYPSSLFVIAKYLIKNNKTIVFKTLLSHGDKLFDHYKPVYKKAFGDPKIINTYGCAEGLLMACQYDLDSYYIMSPEIQIEIVDDGEPVPDGTLGHILVTNFSNFAMPLIRYKLGDIGALLPKNEYPLNATFNYPLLKTLIGRETDIIKTPSGYSLTVHSFTGVMEYFLEIKQFKVIQRSENELLMEYIIDDEKDFNKDCLLEIKNKLNVFIKNDMQITFLEVKSIAPTPSGMPQIIEIRL